MKRRILLATVIMILVSGCTAPTGLPPGQPQFPMEWKSIPPAPVALTESAPVFPVDLAEGQAEEIVKVAFLVNEKGEPIDLHFYSGGKLIEPVAKALRKWRFPPKAGGPYGLLFSPPPPARD